jgi:hypothetical protein
MKHLKAFEKIEDDRLAVKLANYEYDDSKTYDIPRFEVGDIVYADPKLIQNMSMINKELKVMKVFPTCYYVVDRYPNFALSQKRLISEEEYNVNKYNL